MIGPQNAILAIINWSSARASGDAEYDNLITIKIYITIPVIVAEMTPRGMDLLGLARSPDKPTPAVIPVNAGKQIANTRIKGSCTCSPFRTFVSDISAP